MTERTLVLIKPDAVERGLVGEVLARFERKGSHHRCDGACAPWTGDLADQHYAEHVEKAFYPPLKEFMTGGPLVALVLSGDQAIEVVRALVGATDGRVAARRHDPGRPLAVQPGEPGARVGPPGQRQAGDHALVPRVGVKPAR